MSVKRARRKKKKVAIAVGKRKRAIARAYVKEGNGRLRINKQSLNVLNNKYLREFVLQPLNLIGSKVSKIDVDVNVKGGGVMGQLQAIRTAIARAVVKYFDDPKIAETMESFDRYLLGNDVRRVEPKKDRARKARAKYQKSYR